MRSYTIVLWKLQFSTSARAFGTYSSFGNSSKTAADALYTASKEFLSNDFGNDKSDSVCEYAVDQNANVDLTYKVTHASSQEFVKYRLVNWVQTLFGNVYHTK